MLVALFILAACVSSTSPMAAPIATPIPTFTPEPVPPVITTVVDGLLGPIGLAALPDGSLLVAEEGTGGRDDSAGVTLARRGASSPACPAPSIRVTWPACPWSA